MRWRARPAERKAFRLSERLRRSRGARGEVARQTRVLTGVPLWLVREYLEALGGVPDDAGGLSGAGWTARLGQVEDYALGAVRVGRVRVELEGDAASLEALGPRLDRKLLRAGG